MKTINTSVLTGTKGYPGLANVGNESVYTTTTPDKLEGLDFTQQAVKDIAEGLAKAVLTPSQITAQTPVILWGCVLTGGNISAGAVFAYVSTGWEIFYVPTQAIGGTIATYIAASWSDDYLDNGTIAPYTTFSDNTTGSVHARRNIAFTYSSTPNSGNLSGTGTGGLDFGEWQQNQIAEQVPIIVGASGAPAFNAGWGTDVNSVLKFSKTAGLVYIQGDAVASSTSTGTIFTLPVGYRPTQTLYFPLVQITGSAAFYLIVNASGTVQVSATLSYTGEITLNIVVPTF